MAKPISSDTQESIRHPSYVSEGGSFDIKSPHKKNENYRVLELLLS